MIKDNAARILKLIQENDGIDKMEIINPDIELQKIIEIILSECRCSIIDNDGNYFRFGSSTDIRIIKMLIQKIISNYEEIPPEVVSIALTKDNVLGPFQKINIKKIYDEKTDLYDLEMKEIFPSEFHINMFKSELELREQFINEIIKPYVKNIILENDILMSKSPITSYINKYILRLIVPPKTDEELEKSLCSILKKHLKNTNDVLIENIANYIYINIMSNKYFKSELIERTLDATELQKLGKISIGFNGLVESMAFETMQMIELRNFPYGEIISIKDTFYTTVAVLEALSSTFENLSESEILSNIEKINIKYNVTNKNKNQKNVKYRTTDDISNKYGTATEFVKSAKISSAMMNICRMIKVLLEKKESIENEVYIKEVLRIHYRFIKIQPFEGANGRTARAIVNILLQSKGLIGIFRKEKRNEYLTFIGECNKTIKENEEKYLEALSEKTMECAEIENTFLTIENLPFILVKG